MASVAPFTFPLSVYDPYASKDEVKNKHKISLIDFSAINKNGYDFIIIAVAHDIFFKMGIKNIKKLLKSNSIIFDVKGLFNKKDIDLTL